MNTASLHSPDADERAQANEDRYPNKAPTASPAAPKRPLSHATRLLLGVASTSGLLRHKMGIVIEEDGDKTRLKFPPYPRAWLVPNESRTELIFDPDRFYRESGVWSTGEQHMALWLLNVWNPGDAKHKGWHFNLFDAVGTLGGSSELEAIMEWMLNPVWP